MRSKWRLTTTAAVISGLMALTGASPALAQKKPAKPAAAAGKAPAKPAAKAAKGPAKAAKGPAKAAKHPAKVAKAKPLTDKQRKDGARKAYKEAEHKFKEGNYQAALEHYKEADDLLPIAATKYKMAVCRDKLGEVVEAAGAYQVFLDASPDPKKMGDAIADARSRLESLKKTPGKVRIAIEPPTVARLQIAIDNGQPQPAALETINLPPPPPPPPGGPPPTAPATAKGVTLKMAPGHHKITAMGEGFDPSSTELDLSFGETRDAKLTLNPAPPPPPAPIAQEPPPPPPPPPPAAPRSNVPAYVTLGLAGAGLVVGGVFGGLALSSKSTFNKTPTTENADKTDRNALISDMSFAVALTFGVTGAVLLLSNDSPAQEQQKAGAAKPHKKSAVRGFVSPYFSPQGGGAAALLTF